MSVVHPFSYAKMNGAGNRITVLDMRESAHRITAQEAIALAKRADTEFDQLMVLYAPRTKNTAAFMQIFNQDGSLSGACGNGTRCVGWYLMRHANADTLLLETSTGLLIVTRAASNQFTVDMGVPKFDWASIPLSEPFADTRYIELQVGPIDDPVLHSPSVVNMGNPHAIFWVEDTAVHALDKFGPLLENHPLFPERANISLAQIISPDHVIARVWERGAGLTLACGSAACAIVVAGARLKKLERQATVTLPGGDLFIQWQESDDHVLMTGPVELESEGIVTKAMLTPVSA
jgi:diaminopimelate epimerase